MTHKKLIIAVDFDGTIVEHRYPEIGKKIPYSFEVLKQLQAEGHYLILWTYRAGKYLEEAMNFCKKNGLVFYAVNENEPNEEFHNYMSRKIYADIYIDDKNIGGLIDWIKIKEIIDNYDL
ncbi:MAG: HAD hydrolase family protein [Bacteroidales bacterium]|jgi:hydroxymethylpyrimidine pyrophosphatase-like HAD family hydrolase|nr:HAD hydrolase family protein [Bacteroidales bacterium]